MQETRSPSALPPWPARPATTHQRHHLWKAKAHQHAVCKGSSVLGALTAGVGLCQTHKATQHLSLWMTAASSSTPQAPSASTSIRLLTPLSLPQVMVRHQCLLTIQQHRPWGSWQSLQFRQTLLLALHLYWAISAARRLVQVSPSTTQGQALQASRATHALRVLGWTPPPWAPAQP